MLKQQARIEFKNRRSDFSAAQIQADSQAIAELYFKEFEPAEVVHLFIPIPGFNEVDTNFIITRLWDLGKTVCTSITEVKTNTLRTVAFTEEIELVPSKFGVPEPIGGPALDEKDIDQVLVPLLAIDASGNRVGYGKGFYDNFLQKCNSNTQKIGLSLFPPIDEIEDTHDNDVPLDFLITPSRVIKF